ncbi:helix-turn-helix domain-containing protein [Quadrisphaera setariae]|uniref:Helix-turn-helix domain-containing protein n=1 Tax=Quadrisphaera setariae TaxID=2593304 RepID=A0A5C8ZHR9_9ACTN|nr:helix-turn-helix domain-containing protein [Quadrisphaera setariae]TXR56466.1 helix-turn-helix domain-containing protein [Quadrisphaera setariae]
MSDLLTVDEVAALVRTSPSTVRYWRYRGEGLESFRVGRRVLFRREAVERWMAAQRAATAVGGVA